MRFGESVYLPLKIRDICSVISGGTPDTSNPDFWDGDINWFTPSEVGTRKYVETSKRKITQNGYRSCGAKMMASGSILLTSRATIGDESICTTDCCTNQGFQSLTNFKCNKQYLYYYLQSYRIHKSLVRRASGSTFLEISNYEVGNTRLFIPNDETQYKVSSLLSKIDERIETQNKIIEDLKLLIKRSIDSLLHTRFPSEMFELRKLLTERKEKNTNNFPVFSVAVEDGIVNQEEHLGRSFAAKDTSNYNVVRQGNIVYTKSPTGLFPYGIIKQSLNKECVAVSPLYGVYEPKSIIIGSYLHFYFMNPVNANNYLHALVNKGAKNTMNITNQRFLDGKILFPKEIFQNIVGFLESINKKLDLNVEILKKYQRQKEYFLNNLFI